MRNEQTASTAGGNVYPSPKQHAAMNPAFAFIHKATPRELVESNAAVCVFTREEIECGLIGQAVDRLMQMSDDDDLSRRLEASVFLVIDGYESDSRELYEIPECVRFFRALTNEWPYWFHFLERDNGSLVIAMRLLVEVESVRGSNSLERAAIIAEGLDSALMQLFTGLNGFQERIGLDESHTEAATDQILKALELA